MGFKYFPENEELSKKEHERTQQGDGPPVLFLKKGVTQLRIMPPYSNAGAWFRKIEEHVTKSGEGKWLTVTCPRATGNHCPFCDEGEELVEKGKATNDAELTEKGKQLQPRTQFFSNVVCYSSPDGESNPKKGIMVVKYGVTVLRQFLHLNQDEGGWDKITDIENGVDLKVSREGDGFNTKYLVQPMPNRSNIREKMATVGEKLDSLALHNLDELYPPRSYQEMEQIKAGGRVGGFRPKPITPAEPQVVEEEAPVAQPLESVAPVAEAPPATPQTTETGIPAMPPAPPSAGE